MKSNTSLRTAQIWHPGIRSTMLVASLALHGLAFAAFIPATENQEAPIDSLDLSLAPPQGEAMVEEKDAVDSSAQAEAAAAVEKTTPPVAQDDALQEAAKIIEPEADVMSAALLSEPPPPEPAIVDKPVETKLEERSATAVSNASQATEEAFAARAVGVENGLRTGGGATRAAYAAAVKKEIARKKRRPDGDAHGVVSISFVIGPNGAPATIKVEQQAHPALADAARSIIASVQLPPPPGGTFAGTIAIKFE